MTDNSQPSRPYVLINNLLYPAFLGSLIYSVANEFRADVSTILSIKGALLIILLLHFVMDYLYTVEHKSDKYLWKHFVLDFVIILCLLLAMQAAIELSVFYTAVWMLVTKVLALVWEFSEEGKSRYKSKEVKEDAFFAIVYGAFLCLPIFSQNSLCLAVAILSFIVLLDAFAYFRRRV